MTALVVASGLADESHSRRDIMTKRSDVKKTPAKKARKLVVKKEKLADLRPMGAGSENIKGGASRCHIPSSQAHGR